MTDANKTYEVKLPTTPELDRPKYKFQYASYISLLFWKLYPDMSSSRYPWTRCNLLVKANDSKFERCLITGTDSQLLPLFQAAKVQYQLSEPRKIAGVMYPIQHGFISDAFILRMKSAFPDITVTTHQTRSTSPPANPSILDFYGPETSVRQMIQTFAYFNNRKLSYLEKIPSGYQTCSKCWHPGHQAHACTSPAACSKCAQVHAADQKECEPYCTWCQNRQHATPKCHKSHPRWKLHCGGVSYQPANIVPTPAKVKQALKTHKLRPMQPKKLRILNQSDNSALSEAATQFFVPGEYKATPPPQSTGPTYATAVAGKSISDQVSSQQHKTPPAALVDIKSQPKQQAVSQQTTKPPTQPTNTDLSLQVRIQADEIKALKDQLTQQSNLIQSLVTNISKLTVQLNQICHLAQPPSTTAVPAQVAPETKATPVSATKINPVQAKLQAILDGNAPPSSVLASEAAKPTSNTDNNPQKAPSKKKKGK